MLPSRLKILCDRRNLSAEVNAIRQYAERYEIPKVVLVYNLSILNLVKAVFYRAVRWEVLWYQHEVTTYRQKRQNNSVLYSALTRFVELCFTAVSARRCTGNPGIAASSGIHFCPLLRLIDEEAFSIESRDIDLLYVGRPDWRRSPELVDELNATTVGFNIWDIRSTGRFLPDDEFKRLLRRSKFVLNRYTRPIGQSGVTPEALVNGCRVIVSEFDYHAALPDLESALVIIPAATSLRDCVGLISDAVKSYDSAGMRPDLGAVRRYHGQEAFRKYWLSFFYGYNSR